MSTGLYTCPSCLEDKTDEKMCVCSNGHRQCGKCAVKLIQTGCCEESDSQLDHWHITFGESVSRNARCFICRSGEIVQKPEGYDVTLKTAVVQSFFLAQIGTLTGGTTNEIKEKMKSNPRIRNWVNLETSKLIEDIKVSGKWDRWVI